MLTFYLGKSKSGKKDKIFNIVLELASNKKDVLLVVPEQFSFEAEKEMLERVDAKYTSFVSVFNFTSLSNEIKRIYGGNTAKTIDNSTRIMLIHKAIKNLSDELSFFKSKDNSSKALTAITNAMLEIKQQAITSKQLFDASLSLGDSALGMKISDLSKIIMAYESLLGETYIDPVDELTFAYNKIKDNGYFKNKHILFYGFSNFTGQQYKIIKQAICECDNSYFSLCTSGDFDNEFSVFANVNSTYKKILRIASDNNVQTTIEKVENSKYIYEELRDLEKLLSGEKIVPNKSDAISMVVADTKYDELEYVASNIHKRVRTEGLRYRDFAVITRNISEYSNFARGIFKNADVPFFVDDKFSFSELPIASIIKSALKASRSFKTKEIYRYLKSGLTDLSVDEINKIDNYVYLWGIDSKDWLSDFTKNPYGLQERKKEDIELKLAELNELRKRIVLPLIPLSKLKNASAEEFCRAIYVFLDAVNVSKNLTQYVNAVKSIGDENIEQYLISGWKVLNETLQNIHDCYKTDELSFKEFYDILTLCFNNISVSAIPQGLDQVNLISADRVVSLDTKHTFVLGLNYGKFPAEFKSNSLFNSREKGFLEGLNINFNDDYIANCIEENFIAYKAVTSATHSVCLLSCSSDYNGDQEQSPLFKEVGECFNINKEYFPNRDNPYLCIETPLQAINALVRSGDFESLEKLLDRDDVNSDDKALISQILNADTSTLSKLDPSLAKSIYGKELSVSPSKLEQFYKCPYAYLYKYGLKISERDKIDFKFMQRGTIAHYVLEKILLNDFDQLDENDTSKINALIHTYIDEYIASTVGGNNLLDGEGNYLLKRIAAMLYDLVPYVVKELKLSKFKPIRFELKVGGDGEIAPITIKEDDFTAKIGGVVDRVDFADINGQAYIRIVDYKTGEKNFKLSDILFGLNLQMLIYLCAICEDGKLGNNPAAVIYQPLNHIIFSGADKKSNNAEKTKGVVIEDTEIIKAMDPTGMYMPVSFNKDGSLSKSSSTLQLNEFKMVFKYVKKKFAEMCKRMVDGDISPIPCNPDSSHLTCTWCDYKKICGRTSDDYSVTVKSMSKSEFIENIERGNSDGI